MFWAYIETWFFLPLRDGVCSGNTPIRAAAVTAVVCAVADATHAVTAAAATALDIHILSLDIQL